MIEPEVALVGVVIIGDLGVGESRVDPAVDVVLLELADQQRLPVLLDHAVDILLRRGEQHPGFLQLELLADPAVHVPGQESHAVVARHSGGNHRLHIALPELLAPDPRQQNILDQIARQLLTRRQQKEPDKEGYFFISIHFHDAKIVQGAGNAKFIWIRPGRSVLGVNAERTRFITPAPDFPPPLSAGAASATPSMPRAPSRPQPLCTPRRRDPGSRSYP